MSRIIDKLVAASGGWENFLYQTLKDVCKELTTSREIQKVLIDAGFGGGVVEEAREVVAAYEETIRIGGRPIHMPSSQVQPVVEDDSRVVEVRKSMDKNMAGTPAAAHRDRLTNRISPQPISSKPKPQPMSMTARVKVDSEVGASQGELPVPADKVLCHRELLSVTTQGGIELGRGSEDGQVRGQGASGHITLDGKYRLVFTDTTLGIGLINYSVIQVEKEEVPSPTPGMSRPNFQLEEKYPVKPTPPPMEVIGETEIRKEDKEEAKKEE